MFMSRKFMILTALLLFSLVSVVGCSATKSGTSQQTDQQAANNSTESSNPSQVQKPDSQAAFLNEIAQSALQGKTINCEFAVETTVIETVEQKWGDPDKLEYIAAAKGRYATYAKHNAAFGINKGEQIFDVRSYDDRLKELKISKVKEVLGIPVNIHNYETEDMLVYKAGEKYQLLFIFPKATGQNPDPQLDHYNVFYPQGTVNSMANDPGIKY